MITFLVFSPSLFYQYVGDDVNFMGGNTFYSTWKNIPRLVEKGMYISNPREIVLRTGPADVGGGFNYRPITTLSYFLDYSLFKANPYGSHLINVLIHATNKSIETVKGVSCRDELLLTIISNFK